MRRRTFLTTAASAAAGVALSAAGCSTGHQLAPASARRSRGPITLWYSNNTQEVAWGQAMVKAWNAAHPGEEITAQEVPAGKTTEEVIGAAITAGTTPALIFNNSPASTGQFVKQGGLVDLSRFPGADAYLRDRSGAAAALYRGGDGHYRQVPWKSNPVMVFYNKDLFAKAGLDPDRPRLSSYADVLAACERLVASKAAPYALYPAPTSEYFQPNFDFLPLYAAASGGRTLLDGSGRATFDDAAGRAVARFWRTVYARGYAGREQFQGDAFASGHAAMAFVGPWAIASYGKTVHWGAVPVPTPDGRGGSAVHTFADAKTIAMYGTCPHQATAWDVIRFATSREQDGRLLSLTGQMPLRRDLASVYRGYFAAHREYASFGEQAARVVDDPQGPNTITAMQAFRDFYTHAVVGGSGDLDDELAAAARKTTSLARQD